MGQGGLGDSKGVKDGSSVYGRNENGNLPNLNDMMLDSNNTVLSTVIPSHFENTSITELKK